MVFPCLHSKFYIYIVELFQRRNTYCTQHPRVGLWVQTLLFRSGGNELPFYCLMQSNKPMCVLASRDCDENMTTLLPRDTDFARVQNEVAPVK